MNLLPFGELPPYAKRRFVPEDFDVSHWDQIAPLYDRLEARAPAINTVGELERWLLDWSELRAVLDEAGARRYIAMTCHTEDTDAEKAYLHFIENIQPQMKPRQFKLEQLFVQHAVRGQLDHQRYEVFQRDTQLKVDLFRPENVPLETEEAKLEQQYQKLAGSLTVQFRGEEKTLPQMSRFLEEPDRPLRQEAWELVAKRRLQEAGKFQDIFDELVKLRQQMAANAGFKNYVDYAFRLRGRFDYAPEDCYQFHAAIESEIMPVVRELQARRRQQLGVNALRPWDIAVDPLNRPPLRPFEEVDRMVNGTQRVFDHLDKKMSAGFREMDERKLLDLANRKGKAPGGYQYTLEEARLPFIFMNAVGVQRDVETILHEAGHAFHALAAQHEDLHAYRSAPIEFCEVASMSMELLGNEFLEEFYSSSDANRARRTHLENIIGLFPWIATVDAFQHWIYSHPGHTRAERSAAWVELMKRFGGDLDWSGYEEARANLWHRQPHIFTSPFYYVEYGIAQLGALQVWWNSRQDKPKAIHDYHHALGLGGSRPLPELFEAAGCRFAFDRNTIKPLVDLVRTELNRLN